MGVASDLVEAEDLAIASFSRGDAAKNPANRPMRGERPAGRHEAERSSGGQDDFRRLRASNAAKPAAAKAVAEGSGMAPICMLFKKTSWLASGPAVRL